MALLERLAILITADASGAVSEMKKVASEAEKNLGKAGNESSKLSQTMTKTGAAMMGMGAGLLAVGISAASSTADLGREVMKLQRYTGMTAEEASKLRYAAKMSGVDMDTLSAGLGKLSKSMEAGSPAFDKLGISARDGAGNLKSLGDFLPELSAKIRELPNGTEKSAVMLQLFGRNGMALLPFLNKGAEGIKELSDQAEKMGVVLSQDNLGAISANIKSQRELSATFEGLRTKIGLAMMPVLTAFTNLVKSIPAPVLDIIGPLTVFGGIALTGAGALGMLIGQLSNLGPALASVGAWMSANPATAWFIGISAAVGLLAVAFSVFNDNGNEATQTTKEYADAMRDGADATTDLMQKKIEDALASKDLAQGATAAGLSVGYLSDLIKNNAVALHEYSLALAKVHSGLDDGKDFHHTSDAVRAFDKTLADAVTNGKLTQEEVIKLVEAVDKQTVSYYNAKIQQDALDAAQSAYTQNVSELEQAQIAAAEATSKHRDAAENLNKALRAAFDPFFAVIDAAQGIAEGQRRVADATDNVAEKQKALNDAIARYGVNSPEAAKASRDLADAQQGLDEANRNAVKNAIEFDSAMATLVGTVKDNPKAFDDAKAKLNEWVTAGYLTADQARIISIELENVANKARIAAGDYRITVTVDTSQVKVSFDWLNAQLANLGRVAQLGDRITVNGVTYELAGPGWMVVSNAVGGRVGPGMVSGGRPRNTAHLVGELGPELFVPDTAGTIVTAEKTAKMLGGDGAGGTIVTNHITIQMPPGSNGADVVDAIKRYEKINGTRWRK